ncbi:BamA/TamA family outer membrane protein [Segetibacter sp.]|uniref:BamA/TamA family outer membrane protein n=1 Tax=Segetibacter sp. TaxID=2231182 RepID=UPI00260C4248|nr:BamA/TamA family outer membrane protein [Segetibacter sp.]MCW3080943.1 surface antigen precursor [Segetibacter sp.]
MIKIHSIAKDIVKYLAMLFLLSLSFKTDAQPTSTANDSIDVAIAPAYDEVNKFHRFWLGESYRKLWAVPVRMQVFHLSKEKGGLTILQRGGGLQTKSLRLKDPRGRQWVLRSIQKYPERGLPEKLRKTVAKDILQDQVVTGHPYSALTVPPFARALNIPHSNPEIVYVADDPALAEYRADFANSVLLFEEREPVDTIRTDNSERARQELRDDNDTRVDQKLVLRARLLDILMGDWDRHDDQWRWERKKDNNGMIYSPAPRDRDKVYYNTSGVLPWFLSHQWLKSNLQGFKEDIRDIGGYNFNNRYFDRYFLNSLSKEDWKEQIKYVQDKITDGLISEAIRLLPDTIYALSGKKIVRTLIARRNNLEQDGLKYYQFLSKYVDIPTSDKHELFDLENKSNGDLAVTIYKTKKEGTKGGIIFIRTFNPAITREIRLYGFGGKNTFTVRGTGKSPIKVRMLGGADKDSFHVSSEVKNRSNIYIYDQLNKENYLPGTRNAKLRISTDSSVYHFEKHAFKYDQFGPVVSAIYNLDQGVQFRAGIIYQKHGFRKEPFAARHEIFGNYSTGRKAFMFSYLGDVRKVFGKTDLLINVFLRGPENISNFYGVGNETEFIKTKAKGITFYRNRYDYINADIRLKQNVSRHLKLSAGIAAQYYASSKEDNANRYLSTYHASHLVENIFSKRYYAGLVGGALLDTRNRLVLPFKGVYWSSEIRGMHEIRGDKKSYGRVASDLSVFMPVFGDSNLVIVNRLLAGTTIGKPAYFQQMQLGGIQNLRGYHSLRFTGKSMFYHSIQAQLKLFDFNSYLAPGTVGLIGFNDVGRVWVPGELSDKWHDGYGGGLYVVPADLVLIQVVIGHSIEGTQPYITIGVNF